MSTIELIAFVLGFAVALRRLLAVSVPLLSLIPDKWQPYVAAGLVALPQLIDVLGGATTELDLATAVLMAAGVFVAALRGKVNPPVALALVFMLGGTAAACGAFKGPDAPRVDPCSDAAYVAVDRACAKLIDSAQTEVELAVAGASCLEAIRLQAETCGGGS